MTICLSPTTIQVPKPLANKVAFNSSKSRERKNELTSKRHALAKKPAVTAFLTDCKSKMQELIGLD